MFVVRDFVLVLVLMLMLLLLLVLERVSWPEGRRSKCNELEEDVTMTGALRSELGLWRVAGLGRLSDREVIEGRACAEGLGGSCAGV